MKTHVHASARLTDHVVLSPSMDMGGKRVPFADPVGCRRRGRRHHYGDIMAGYGGRPYRLERAGCVVA